MPITVVLADHFSLGTWRGFPRWACNHCQFDTLDGESVMVDHLIEAHFPPPPPDPAPLVLVADKRGNQVQGTPGDETEQEA